MKAIIIQDHDARALLDKLKLETFNGYCDRIFDIGQVPKHLRQGVIDEIHRKFHYVVAGWLSEQGASLVR